MASSPDKPPGAPKCRRGQERGRSIPFATFRGSAAIGRFWRIAAVGEKRLIAVFPLLDRDRGSVEDDNAVVVVHDRLAID